VTLTDAAESYIQAAAVFSMSWTKPERVVSGE